MKAKISLAILMLGCVVVRMNAQDANPPAEDHWKQVCAQALVQPFTAPSFSNPQPESELRNCDSEALYYGFDGAPNPSAALECAYYQRAHPNPSIGDPFAGTGVLAMLYANGQGVPRNYNLAIRFACENPWAAETETELRIAHLERLRDTGETSQFDLCDNATSGLMQGACEDVHQKFADAKRRRELESLSSRWSPEVKQAFKALQQAEEEFENARTSDEVDLSGTGRAAFALAEQGRLRDQFLINLKRFAKGEIPPASQAEHQAVDRRLNAVYQKIQKSPEEEWQYGTIRPAGIRDTQRAWLTLRDRWIDFARLAYPALSAARLSTQLTRLRLHQLLSLGGAR